MKQSLSLLFCSLAVALSASSSAQTNAEDLLYKASVKILDAAGLNESESLNFRIAFLKSPEWQHEFWDSGPLPKPDQSARLLLDIWKADPDLEKRPLDRGMATACALAGADRNWDADRMIARYKYFRDNWNNGSLNDMYRGLSVFYRRYLANGVQHAQYNSLESMEYLLREASLPSDQYTGACWYPSYQGHNAFGDSVQGSQYYTAFQNSWGSGAEITRNVGGVCGALSNFGAAAAIANGIPGMTMGEPGHCANLIMTRLHHWQPAYSLSWQRGLHYSFYGHSWGWHILNSNAYGDAEKAYKSGDLRRAALDAAEQGNTDRAIAKFREARQSYPADYQNWLASADFIKSARLPASAYEELYQDTLQYFVADYPEAAWTFLKDRVYSPILPKGDDQAAARARVIGAYHKALKNWGAGRWDLARAIRDQMNLISKDADIRDQFTLACAVVHMENSALLPSVLDAQFAECEKDPKRKSHFIQSLAQGLSRSNGQGDGFKDGVIALTNRLLPEAASSRDRTTFQFLGKLASQFYKPSDIQADPFPGVLLSSGGILAVSGTGNRWDSPYTHWGVIEPHGGDFHTSGSPATAAITLGQFGKLSGVVIVQRSGHQGRVNGARLQVSSDGSTWSDVYTFHRAGRIIRIDLQDKNIEAGYVRVIQDSRNEPIHFHRFLVYGDRRS